MCSAKPTTVADRVAHEDLARSIGCLSLGNDDLEPLRRGDRVAKRVDVHVEDASDPQLRDPRDVREEAGPRLHHDLLTVAREQDESGAAVVRDFDLLVVSERARPECQGGLNLVDDEDGGDLADARRAGALMGRAYGAARAAD